MLVTGGVNAADKKQIAFVVNGPSDFWKMAEAGVRKAQELPDYDCCSSIPNAPMPPSSSA